MGFFDGIATWVGEVGHSIGVAVNDAVTGVGNFVGEVASGVSSTLDNIGKSLGGFFGGSTIEFDFNTPKNTVTEPTNPTIFDIPNLIIDGAGKVLSDVGETIGGGLDWIKDGFGDVINSVGSTINGLKDYLGGAIGDLGNGLWSALQSAAKWISDGANTILKGLGDLGNSIGTAISNTITGIVNSLKLAWDAMALGIDGIWGGIADIADFLVNPTSAVMGSLLGAIAKGAVDITREV